MSAVLERIHNRPDSEHEQALVRIGLVSVYLLAYTVYGLFSGNWHKFGLAVLLVYLLVSPAALLWIYLRPDVSHFRRTFFATTDHLAIACVLISGPAYMQALYPLLLWVDVGNGARFGRRYHLLSTAMSTVTWLIVLNVNPYWRTPGTAAFGYGLLAGILFLPFYARLFRRRLEQTNTRLQETCNNVTRLVTRDPVTGLPNRIHLYQRLNGALAAAHRCQRRLAIFYIDLDNFKRINDESGHHVGDEALCTAAEVFRQRTRMSDVVARVGGDEFIIVLMDVTTDKLEPIGNSLVAALAMLPMPLSASIGVAVYPECGTTVDNLIHSADVAMYQAKRAGGNRCINAAPCPPQSETSAVKQASGNHDG
jgi:diguanylate cyclase (GGDEF)-like protein